jgi:hypothetical protein
MTPTGSDAPSPVSSASDVVIPVTTASGTDVTATVKQTHPHAMRSSTIKLSPGSGNKKLDSGARMADDASVLPVPSHVVLHHLTTSTIKNGVLAVASTVRYKKKVCKLLYEIFVFADYSCSSLRRCTTNRLDAVLSARRASHAALFSVVVLIMFSSAYPATA